MSRSTKLSFIVGGLVAVLAISHRLFGTTLEDLTKKKPSGDSAPAHEAEGKKKDLVLPQPMGVRGAPIQVKVYVTGGNECDTSTLAAMKGIGAKYGKQVYVQFVDLRNEQVQAEAHKAKLGCKSGLTINGQSKFMLPGRGLHGAVLFDGPAGQKNYKMSDVEAVVEHLLKKAKAKHGGSKGA